MSILTLVLFIPIILGCIFLFGVSIYALILLIQLMKRSIIALDIYIDKNR